VLQASAEAGTYKSLNIYFDEMFFIPLFYLMYYHILYYASLYRRYINKIFKPGRDMLDDTTSFWLTTP